MYVMRRWAVRNAGWLERFYAAVEPLLIACHPLWRTLGYARLERPIAFIERHVKGFFFDCRMCGQCVLSFTGMACPMNCPKQLRNGPCGGVRLNGNCEVDPDMRCVWIEAAEGAARMRHGLEKNSYRAGASRFSVARTIFMVACRAPARRVARTQCETKTPTDSEPR